MIRCSRCGAEVPRTDARQSRCPRCEREVAAIVAADERRRTPRFRAKDLTGAVA